MSANQAEFSIAAMARVLGVSEFWLSRMALPPPVGPCG